MFVRLIVLAAALIPAIAPSPVLAQDSGQSYVQRLATVDDFEAVVLAPSQSHRVVVMASAVWCDPCRQIMPSVQETAERTQTPLVILNMDEQYTAIAALGITTIPAFIAYQNGQPVDTLVGVRQGDHPYDGFMTGTP